MKRTARCPAYTQRPASPTCPTDEEELLRSNVAVRRPVLSSTRNETEVVPTPKTVSASRGRNGLHPGPFHVQDREGLGRLLHQHDGARDDAGVGLQPYEVGAAGQAVRRQARLVLPGLQTAVDEHHHLLP